MAESFIKKIFKYEILVIIFVFLLDRISKVVILNVPEIQTKIYSTIIPFLDFQLIWNSGIAFGLLSFEEKTFYNLITTFIILITIIIVYLAMKSNGLEKFSFLVIIGGSLGNIFDRLYYSAVPDFIDINYNNFHWFIFNVADIFITIGVILLIIREIFLKEKIK